MKTKKELIDKILKKNKEVRNMPELNEFYLRQYNEKDLEFINEVYEEILLDSLLISLQMLNTKRGREYVKYKNNKEIEMMLNLFNKM